MAAFAIEDVVVKTLSDWLSVGQIMLFSGVSGALVFLAAALIRNESLISSDIVSPLMCVRMVFEIIGRGSYILAITLNSLSSATIVLQTTPIIVVMGAAIILKEKVCWRRWGAVLFGLIGVLIVIRPGTEGFYWTSVFTVLAAVGFAGRDIASRVAPQTIGTTGLGFYGFLAVIIVGLLFSTLDSEPFGKVNLEIWPYIIILAVTGVGAYASLMMAMRIGEVSVVAPFRYTRLVFGVCLGVLIFGESFDGWILTGCLLILLSGWFVVSVPQREIKLKV